MIRVNHAGEHGAIRIYDGQLAVLQGTKAGAVIETMRAQEDHHSKIFDKLIHERHVRPTLLSPLWSVAGYALGYVTARLGPQAAMACTVAVEDVINDHYEKQEEALTHPLLQDPELLSAIQFCRLEEQEHRDIALAHEATRAPGYRLLSKTIRAATKMAISLSKRI
jgi:ubiquinone biosynthesis monooxygenase Coq7